MKWPYTKTDLFLIAENFAINTLATLSINDQLPVGKSAGGQWLTPCMEMLGFEPQSQQSDPGNPLYREHSWWTCGCGCTHTCTRILNALISKARYDNARTSFIVSHTHPNTSRTGPLHDCPWLWVNKPCPHPPATHPPSLCSVVSNSSTGRQHSAVFVLSSARGPNNIEFSSTGIHKHTAPIILPRT